MRSPLSLFFGLNRPSSCSLCSLQMLQTPNHLCNLCWALSSSTRKTSPLVSTDSGSHHTVLPFWLLYIEPLSLSVQTSSAWSQIHNGAQIRILDEDSFPFPVTDPTQPAVFTHIIYAQYHCNLTAVQLPSVCSRADPCSPRFSQIPESTAGGGHGSWRLSPNAAGIWDSSMATRACAKCKSGA